MRYKIECLQVGMIVPANTDSSEQGLIPLAGHTKTLILVPDCLRMTSEYEDFQGPYLAW
jgi:hypothetical protein